MWYNSSNSDKVYLPQTYTLYEYKSLKDQERFTEPGRKLPGSAALSGDKTMGKEHEYVRKEYKSK